MARPVCWTPCVDESATRAADRLLWHKGLGNHVFGDFSMAMVQANTLLEDQCRLESGPLSSFDSGPVGTFVGVYDGHGGNEASRFISHNLFPYFKAIVSEQQEVSATVIKKAFLATEDSFLSLVKKQWLRKPHLASVGSCCLVGVVCDGLLYVANAGDSRVVLGRMRRGTREVKAVQLSVEHNADVESVRDELRSLHPDDPNIVVLRHNVWRIKGLIQVSRSIGDAYLKKPEFNQEPLPSKYRLAESFQKPILNPEPAIVVHKLQPEDQFLVFASDGLWEHLTNQEVINIVCSHPRNGIARRLVKSALTQVAKKREMRYDDLKKIDQGVRRYFHDDITVVVVFIDYHTVNRDSFRNSLCSIRGGVPTSTSK